MPAQLPPVAEASPSGQPPMPPPLPPPLPTGALPPAPPPLPPAIGGGPGGPGGPGGASARGSLLASITDGKKLKKMERPPPAPDGDGGGGGNDLLAAIRCVLYSVAYTVNRYGFAQGCYRFSALSISTTGRLPLLNIIFFERFCRELSTLY